MGEYLLKILPKNEWTIDLLSQEVLPKGLLCQKFSKKPWRQEKSLAQKITSMSLGNFGPFPFTVNRLLF